MESVVTNQKCCDSPLYIDSTSNLCPEGVGWGEFSKDGGSVRFSLRCVCKCCGQVFDPDCDIFAPYYNMAADRLARPDSPISIGLKPQAIAEIKELELRLKLARARARDFILG
jgi:hypothetical protein